MTNITNHKNSVKLLLRYAFLVIAFAVVYYLVARLGLELATFNQNVSPVWPATGFAIGILIRYGLKFWPAVFLGAFVANFGIGSPLPAVVLISIGNALEAIAGKYLYKKINQDPARFGIYTESMGVITASLLASLVSSIIGVFALRLTSIAPTHLLFDIWLTWWIGDVLGGLIILPVMLFVNMRDFSLRKSAGILGSLLLCGFLSWAIFFHHSATQFLFILFPILLIVVWFFTQSAVLLSTVLICGISIWSTNIGLGIFRHGITNSNLVHLQLFLAAVGCTALILADLKRAKYLHYAVVSLLFGWFFAGLIFASFHKKSNQMAHEEYLNLIGDAEESVHENSKLIFSLLRASSGFYLASNSVEPDEWKTFSRSLDVNNKINAVRGIGLVYYVTNDKLKSFEELQWKNGRKDFAWHVVNNGPIEKRILHPAYHYIIAYVEPLEANMQAIGLDLASEEYRKAGGDLARDSGLPTISENIQLVQDAVIRQGFLMYYPIYKGGIVPESVEERRKMFVAFSYTPVNADVFFTTAISEKKYYGISFSVSRVTSDGRRILQAQKNGFENLSNDSLIEREVKIANQIFNMQFKRTASISGSEDTTSSWAGTSSAFLCLLLGAFLASLQTVKEKAVVLAEFKTKELKASEEKWKFAIEGGGDGVWDWLIPTGELHLSKRWKELLGFEESEVGSTLQEWESRVHSEDLPAAMQLIKKHFAGESNYSIEYRMKTKDGEYKWFLDRGMVVSKDKQGNPLRMIGTISDISLRKKQESDLELQRIKLVSAAKMSSLGEMAGGMAHEINNPLAIISSKAALMKDKVNAQKFDAVEFLDGLTKIEITAHRIAKIIKGLRSFSRNAENDPMQPVLVSGLIFDTLSLCSERFKKNEIELRVKTEEVDGAHISGRSAQLAQVLVNLLSNSYDAVETMTEKWVELRCERRGDKIHFSVTDSGKGIDKDILPKIMNPFFTTKVVGKGTGLGLSITKGIIEEHASKLIYDEKCKNTCFYFELLEVKT